MGISAEDVIIPCHPEVGDMLQVCGTNNEVCYAHVHTIESCQNMSGPLLCKR